MADLKRWFKVWVSITDDPAFQSLSLEAIGRWSLLGAVTANVGESGVLKLPPEPTRLMSLLRVSTKVALLGALAELPNVILSDAPVRWPHGHDKPPECAGVAWCARAGLPGLNMRGLHSFEEWCSRNGEFIVTIKNWRKYQEDATAAARGRALRSKRRGEEMRSRGDTTPPLPPAPRGAAGRSQCQPEPEAFTRFWAAYPRHVGKPGTLKAWCALKPSNGTVEEILAGLTRWCAWWSTKQTPSDRVPYPATWLRDRRWEDTPDAPVLDPYAQYPRA